MEEPDDPALAKPHRPCMLPLALSHYTLTNALGAGKVATLNGLRAGLSGLEACHLERVDYPCYIGRVKGLEDLDFPEDFKAFDCRNHRLAWMALAQDHFEAAVRKTLDRHGAERIAVVMGTSTSGIESSETAYRQRNPEGRLPPDFKYQGAQNTAAPAAFIKAYFGIQGPAFTVSTACASSAQVFVSAQRLLSAGWVDAVLVGGVDSLCLTTLHGFHSLELVSQSPSKPGDAKRSGISIGEAAGFALLERASGQSSPIQLIGMGESQDAHHMASPHPGGLGARLAMQRALTSAKIPPEAIDFVLLHGTGTLTNDAAEDAGISGLLGPKVPCASIKGAIGHTLGAAGITNALVGALCLELQFSPGTQNTQTPDPTLKIDLRLAPEARVMERLMTNAFGFGGINTSLILARNAKGP